MPRPRSPHYRTRWNISLPAGIAAEVEMLLLDPLTGKPSYAKRSELIVSLLQRWLEEHRAPA